MKRRRVVGKLTGVVLALWAAVASAAGEPAAGAVTAQTVRLPSGPNSVRGLSDNVSVQVFSAQVGYSVPVELPSGQGGLAPSLSLSYSGDLGNGPLGVGWGLPVAAVRRSVRLGVPTYTAGDELEVMGIGSGGRLVALPDGSWRVEGQGHGVKVERQGDGFVITQSGGVRYLLGVTAAGRQQEGTRVAAWYAEEVVHPTGALVRMAYEQEGGQVYLSRLEWGPAFAAQLVYETRADKAVSYRTGFRVETARRLKEVRVEAFGELLRLYTLTYDDTLPLSRLHQVTMQGRGGVGALPTLTFSYAEAAPSSQVALQNTGGWVLNTQGVSLADVDGDGMTDLLRLTSTGHSWRKGLGTGFGAERALTGAGGASLTNSRIMDVDGDVRPDVVMSFSSAWQPYRLEGTVYKYMGSKLAGTDNLPLFDASLSLADLNGDGRTDLVRSGSTLHVKWNTGQGYSGWMLMPSIAGTGLLPSASARLHEVNGDGLADVVQLSTEWMRVFHGKGDGTFVATAARPYPWGGVVGDLSDLRMGDLNRDGLMDLVRVFGGHAYWYAGLAHGGFSLTPRVMPRPTTRTDVVVTLADLNGNGSEDVVWSAPDGMWALDMAGGTSAGMLAGVDNGMGKTLALGYQGSAELAVADALAGNPWQRLLPISIPVPVSMEVNPGAGAPVRRVEYTVRDGFWDTQERRFGGFLVGGVRTLGNTPESTLYEETLFHPGTGTDRALRGLTLEVKQQDGTGRLFTRAVTTWEARTAEGLPADAVLLRKPAQLESRTFHYEGAATPQETLVTYTYDARVRPEVETSWGRLDKTGDESVTVRTWTQDEATWVHDVVCEEKVQESDGTLRTYQRTYYTDMSNTVLPLCQPGLGWVRERHSFLAEEAGPGRWVRTASTEYDGWGNPVRAEEDGVVRTLTYDTAGLNPVTESVTPETGRTLTWRLTWDDVLGEPKQLEDPNGVVQEVGYDTLGRLTSMAVNGAPPHVHHVYDWSAPTPRTWTYAFDGVHAELGGGWTGTWQPGARWRQSVTVSNGAGEALYTATRLDLGRWVISGWKEMDGRGDVTFMGESFYWDGPGLPSTRPTELLGQTFAFDALGRLSTQTLPTGSTKSILYKAFESTQSVAGQAPVTTFLDGLGRIMRTERQVGSVVESVDASHDAAGRLLTLSLQGGLVTHRYTYDTLGRVSTAEDPDLGLRSFLFNDQSQLTHQTNAANETRQYFYDAAGRLTRTQAADGTSFTYHYDVPRDGASGHNTESRLAWVEEPRGEVHFAYDALGRTVTQRRRVDTLWAEEALAFSPSGLLLSSTVDGAAIATSYDEAGRPSQVGSYWKALRTDASGRVLEEEYGNGVNQVYTLDTLGLTHRVETRRTTAGQLLYDVTLTRNDYGVISAVTDTDGRGLDHSASFTYDTAFRLTDAIIGTGPSAFTFRYRYDGLQNMTWRESSGPKALGVLAGTYRYGERGFGPRQLTSIVGSSGTTELDYDTAGRVIRLGDVRLSYNSLDQVKQVTLPQAPGATSTSTIEYAYGYDGQRIFARAGEDPAQYWFFPHLTERAGKRERYVKLGERTVAKVSQSVPAPADGGTAGAGDPTATGGTTAGAGGTQALHQGVKAGAAALLLSAAALLLALALNGPRRPRRLGVALTLLCLLATSCDTGLKSSDGALRRAASLETPETLYFHTGVSAGPVMLTRANGTLFEERRYEPFGEPIDAFRELPDGSTSIQDVDHQAEPLNSLNKDTDAVTGFSYHGARWMASKTASWLTPDPPVKAPDAKFLAQPWDLHPYQYVRQNPITYWDPNGKEGSWFGGNKMEALHTALDIVGFIPGVGEIADGANALLYLAEGRKAEAALSAASMIPFADIAAKGSKYAYKIGKEVLPHAVPVLKKVVSEGVEKAKKFLPAPRCSGGTCGVPGGCFVAGTLVLTQNGAKPIEDIQAGEWVWARSETGSEESGWRQVLRTQVREDQDILKLRVAGDSGHEEELGTTGDHPFWVEGKGWTEAAALQPGDLIPSAHGGWLRVTASTWAQHQAAVFNLEVDELHTYFVGQLGAWAHNNAKCFDTVRYGSKARGLHKHHGILDAWAKNNVPGYVSRAKDHPTIALSKEAHEKAHAEMREWMLEKFGTKDAAQIDWSSVSKREIKKLSERMFDAADVPKAARQKYYDEYNKYVKGL